MYPEKIETGFATLKEAVQTLQFSLASDFFEAFSETIENLVDSGHVRVEDNQPDADTVAKLTASYGKLLELKLDPEEWRRVTQLVLLDSFRTLKVQANHQLTPDSIGYLLVFLIQQLQDPKAKSLEILDITTGTANLLLTVSLNLQLAGMNVTANGVDNDPTLIEIAAATSALVSEVSPRLYHQDALQNLLVDPVDFSFGDLPIGFYPDDENAQKFATSASTGHSYAHHLLMEQALNYTKEAGYGLFLVPSNFLESEQAPLFKNWLSKTVYLQGIIQLPDELFASETSRKSIIILQKHGEQAAQASQVLLAKLHSLKDPKEVTKFFEEFRNWKASKL